MNLFGYPIEIWLAGTIGVLIRLQTSNRLTVLGAITTVCVAIGAALVLYAPITVLLGLGATWHVPIAVMIALTSENLMKALVEISADKEWIKDWIRHFVEKDKKNE